MIVIVSGCLIVLTPLYRASSVATVIHGVRRHAY